MIHNLPKFWVISLIGPISRLTKAQSLVMGAVNTEVIFFCYLQEKHNKSALNNLPLLPSERNDNFHCTDSFVRQTKYQLVISLFQSVGNASDR